MFHSVQHDNVMASESVKIDVILNEVKDLSVGNNENSATARGGRIKAMHDILRQLTHGVDLTGDIACDVPAFLVHHGRQDTAAHCAAVAVEARRVAHLVAADAGAAEQAGWLHD